MEIAKEKKIVKLMIQIYSEGHDKKPLNENQKMQELLDYAYFRLDKCPFKDNKKFCSKCKVHCYKPEMRQQIKNSCVMLVRECFLSTRYYYLNTCCRKENKL